MTINDYSEGKLRSLLSKYANERIESIQCLNNQIFIQFKEGYATSWLSGYIDTSLTLDSLEDMKEACKKAYLIEGEETVKQELGIPSEKSLKYSPKDNLELAKRQWGKTFTKVFFSMIEGQTTPDIYELKKIATKETDKIMGFTYEQIYNHPPIYGFSSESKE